MNNKKQVKNNDGRSSDVKFMWLLKTHGKEWLQWQQLAEEWMEQMQQTAVSSRLRALTSFFEIYLLQEVNYAIDVIAFLNGKDGHICSSSEFKKTLLNKGNADDTNMSKLINCICDFIDWVIKTHFSIDADNGVSTPMFVNPLSKVTGSFALLETVKTPLPYRYMQHIRDIVCPKVEHDTLEGRPKKFQNTRHFKHWEWAQQQTGQTRLAGDWFEVDYELIDKSDPDCVWRSKEIKFNKKTIIIYQIWSPVVAMVIFIKLHLPLRTYQVRMLDSGEADTYRYESSVWKLNTTHNFCLGSQKNPYERGVFKRIYDNIKSDFSTGLYINSNKTADQNKDEADRGYIIPWENEEVLYWLEKLRNWQEKYNPIEQATDCTSLKNKHLGTFKSKKSLEIMGNISFLFRDASSKGDDKFKPIPAESLKRQWYQLLLTLENRLFEKGDRLNKGGRLKLVKDYPEGTPKGQMYSTLFPLHSLRVSLITCYAMDSDLPLSVIAKLLAGHTRLLSSVYYTKISPSVMATKMVEGETLIEQASKQSVKDFLKDASISQIQCKMVYHNEKSISAALVNRNPIGWEERSYGMCLVGGNTVKSDEISTLGGCWNGNVSNKELAAEKDHIFGPVPNGPENCVRCRWFITEAKYLPALVAHLNQVSYKTYQAAIIAKELETVKNELLDEEFSAELNDLPFTKYDKLQIVERRLEKQKVETNNHAEDFIATFNLVNRITQIEEQRTLKDSKDKLIAVGDRETVNQSVRFVESSSELLHLSVICDQAEFYPDLEDELRKTPAIQKRSSLLNRILMKKGYEPMFMEMDEKQQLISANAMIRHMAKIADPNNKLEGYRKVSGYLEAEEYMNDQKLLNEGIGVLTRESIALLPNPITALLEGKK